MKRLFVFAFSLALMLLALVSCLDGNQEHEYSGACDPSCNVCNEKTRDPEEAHTYDDCFDSECNVCNEVRTATGHTYDSPCDTDCNVCKEIRDASAHIYTNSCDSECDFCGALRMTEHIYSNACDTTCNACGALRIPNAHTYSNACDSTCDVCGELRMASNHVYSSVCDAECDVCSEFRIASPHTYDHVCDADCNVCGATRNVSDHTYDNVCDAICNTCGTARPNIHDFSEWMTKTNADCENPMVEYKYCGFCGAEETREVGEALGHIFDDACDVACNRAKCNYKREVSHSYSTDYAVEIPASCTTAEILARYCDICGAKETATGEAALGHVYDNNCDTTCNRGNCDYVRVITHIFGEWSTLTPANCTDVEIEHRICDVCDAEETRDGDEAALDHLFDNNCDTSCNRGSCGFIREITHAFGEWETATPATCTEAEVEIRICSVCSAEETQEGDAALNHLYTNNCDAVCDRGECGFERIPPHDFENPEDLACNGCGQTRECPGHQPYVLDCTLCRICGQTIPGAEHAFGEWVTKTPATCTEAEIEVQICDNCGMESPSREGDAALDHLFDNACDTSCNRTDCGYTRAITHAYSEWTTLSPATCTEAEIETRSCSICFADETRVGDPALNHLFDNDCDTTCNRTNCDYVRVITHSFGEWVTKSPADCTTAEVEHRICDICSAEETRTGDPALDHLFDNDCDTSCNRTDCGYTRAITHAYSEWTTLSPATCTEAEVEEQICSVCGTHNPATRIGDPALDHLYTNECDASCDRACGAEDRIPPHRFADEHDVTCENGCGYVRECTGHKALSTNCQVCEYCGAPIPDSTHEFSNLCDTTCNVCGTVREVGDHVAKTDDCTVCQYCLEQIPGAAHVATANCTKCDKCGATIQGASHTKDPTNCARCTVCGNASGFAHTSSSENCTQCGVCGKSTGTAHSDKDSDGKCDQCPQETLPGENWFPWAPL